MTRQEKTDGCVTRMLEVLTVMATTLDKAVDKLISDDSAPTECMQMHSGEDSYLVIPDRDLYPKLRMQMDTFPKSRMDALHEYPDEVQARIIQKVVTLHRSVDNARDNINLYKDLIAKINERHDLDLMIVAARGSNDIVVLIDRPSKSVFFLYKGMDQNDEEFEEQFMNIELDIPDAIVIPDM